MMSTLIKQLRRRALGVCLAVIAMPVAAAVQAEEGTLLKTLLSHQLQRELNALDRPDRGWSYLQETHKMAWLDVGIYRQEFFWKESVSLNLWVDPQRPATARVEKLVIEGNQVQFRLLAQMPLIIQAQGQLCHLMRTDLDAGAQVELIVEGTVHVQEGKLIEPEFQEVTARIESLDFEHPCCRMFAGVTRRAINGAIAARQAWLCEQLAERMDRRPLLAGH